MISQVPLMVFMASNLGVEQEMPWIGCSRSAAAASRRPASTCCTHTPWTTTHACRARSSRSAAIARSLGPGRAFDSPVWCMEKGTRRLGQGPDRPYLNGRKKWPCNPRRRPLGRWSWMSCCTKLSVKGKLVDVYRLFKLLGVRVAVL